MEPYFSIIILTYNKFDNLENNLQSIFRQKFTEYEIILSDDGSSNFCREFVESLFKKNQYAGRYRIISHKDNVGTVKNYNQAISMSKGEYIIPLSQDDCFKNEYVLYQMNKYLEKNHSMVFTSMTEGKKSKKILPNRSDVEILEQGKNKLFKRLLISNFISGASLYIKRECWLKLDKFDERFCLLEDYPFILKCVQNNIKIDFFDQITIVRGEDGVSSWSNKIKPVFQKDLIRNYQLFIQPNFDSLISKWVIRYLKYEIWKIRYANNAVIKALGNFVYGDVTLRLCGLFIQSVIFKQEYGDRFTNYVMHIEEKKCK